MQPQTIVLDENPYIVKKEWYTVYVLIRVEHLLLLPLCFAIRFCLQIKDEDAYFYNRISFLYNIYSYLSKSYKT